MVATKQGSITFKREVLIKKGRIYLKRSSLIERVVLDVILRHIVTREERRTAGDA